MNGLSMLFGVLIIVFLAVVLFLNFFNTPLTKPEGFDDAPASKGQDKGQSPIETQIRAVLDPMAFYNSPDGTPYGSGNTDGEQLCSLFTKVREALSKNEASGQTLSDSEVSKRVEESLRAKIPGGALPCPLLKYPVSGSSDLEWLSFLQAIPVDFGARVVLMAQYADYELTTTASKLKDALGGKVDIPALKESFISVCPPTLANKKRDDKKQLSCELPEDLSPAQIQQAVAMILQQLVAQKTTILKANMVNPAMNIHASVKDAKAAADYLKTQQAAMQSGSLGLSEPVAKLS